MGHFLSGIKITQVRIQKYIVLMHIFKIIFLISAFLNKKGTIHNESLCIYNKTIRKLYLFGMRVG